MGLDNVEHVLQRALSKRAEDRFPTMEAFAVALSAAAKAPSHRDVVVRDPFHDVCDVDRQLHDLITYGPTASISFGAAGVAYGLHRLACALDDPKLFAHAQVWAKRAHDAIDDRRAFTDLSFQLDDLAVQKSVFFGMPGVHAACALVSHAAGDLAAATAHVMAITRETTNDCRPDLVLGDAGRLLACAVLLDEMSGLSDDTRDSIVQHGNAIANALNRRIDADSPTRSETIESFGMAHGWCGNLYAFLRWHTSSNSPLPPRFESWVDELATFATIDRAGASWPYGARVRADQTTSWCNGAAGMTILWCKLAEQDTYDRAGDLAEKAAEHVWQKMEGAGNVCCGSAGGALALGEMSRLAKDPKWRHRAHTLAERSSNRGVFGYGLFKGLLGIQLTRQLIEADDSRFLFG